MEDKLTKCITDFRKSHNTQHSLLAILEKWKRGIDNKAISLLYLWTFLRHLIQSMMNLC